MKIYKNLIGIIFIFLFTINAKSQINEETSSFYFDAVFFKGDADTNIRLDVFVVVPYQALNFVKIKEIYSSKYTCNISITDSLFNIIDSKKFEKTLVEDNYNKSQGGTGAYDYSQNIFNLIKGKYFVKVSITDDRNNRVYERTRAISPVNFNDYNFSLSSIMLLSRVEENEGKYKITPHISDEVGDFKEGYFAFFEIYSKNTPLNCNFLYTILNKEGKEIYKSKTLKYEVMNKTSRHFLKIINPENITEGKHILRIYALKSTADTNFSENDVVAIAERSIKFQRTFAGVILKDIDKSIKQLRYIAIQSEMDLIEAGSTIEERQKRFEAFWKKFDPSPNTDRNEAFEEYYSRIDYANKNFKSYGEGWRSDKGMVYVVYGQPFNMERSGMGYDGRVYESWTYRNNKQFVFVDYNGFGEWRLYSPLSVNDKYKWE